MNKKCFSTSIITLTGLGIALFVVLSMMLRVPVFENYYLCLGYIAMAVYLYSFGTTCGTIVGVVGTIIYCLLINGLRGMPGWAIGNIAIGLILGLWFKFVNKINKHRNLSVITYIITAVVIAISVAIGILGIKSVVEVILYAQPFAVRVVSNMYAFVADVFVLCISLPLCVYLDRYIKKAL